MYKAAFVTGKTGLLAPIWKETLEGMGYDVMMYGLPEDDVTDKEKLNKLAETYTPDVIVNNAAIDNSPDSKASFFGNCDKILEVNLIGAVNVCNAFIPKMKENGGVIVNIGSIMGYGGADYRNYEDFDKPIGYNLSKWGLRGLTKSIAVQYGRHNIRSVTISFGPYDGGKLDPVFLSKFIHNVPLKRTVSRCSLEVTLKYAIACQELTGQDWRIDGGLGSWA